MADATFGVWSKVAFEPGQRVTVRRAYPIGHCRTPLYLRGITGVIERFCGAFPNPEELAYRRDGLPAIPLYRVRARLIDVRPDYAGPKGDTIEVEVFEHWLNPDLESDI